MLITTSINQLQNSIVDNYGLFICFNSFETRSVTITSNFDVSRAERFLVLTNEITRDDTQHNLDALLKYIPKEKRTVITLSTDKPVSSADKIKTSLFQVKDVLPSGIFIDITTFTHEMLLILLAILKEEYPNAKVTCGYVNAKEYSYDTDIQENKWLSKGIGSIRSVLGYSGIIKPSQKTLLIVIVGYEYERALSIIDSIEPDFLSLGYGEASNAITEKNRGANMCYAQLVKQMATYYEDVSDFTIPCNDPFEAAKIIKEQVVKIGQQKNIIIVPMNNKLTTIGAALVSYEMPNIQLCYAPAIVYNYSSYSIPGDKLYLFDLTF